MYQTIRIVEIKEQTVWTSFLSESADPTFLQTWEWSELQQRLGYQIMRVGIQADRLIGVALCIIVKSKRGNFIFLPHGPIISQKSKVRSQEIITALLFYLKQVARESRCDFVRIAPILPESRENTALFARLGCKTAPIYMHAERVWMLPLTNSLDQILATMRKTTRYSIKKAQKLGIRIETKVDTSAIDIFWSLYQTTAKREGFVPFSKQFIIDEFSVFHKTGNALFVLGYEENLCTAAALIIFTQNCAFYHQGATLHSKLPTSYLLQWEAIKEAKKRGCRTYSFWGTYKKYRTPEDWKGLSLYKEGFGGFQTDYCLTQDYILNPKYYISYLFDTYLKWKRGIAIY